jgi:hypothetical protein
MGNPSKKQSSRRSGFRRDHREIEEVEVWAAEAAFNASPCRIKDMSLHRWVFGSVALRHPRPPEQAMRGERDYNPVNSATGRPRVGGAAGNESVPEVCDGRAGPAG